MKNNHSQFLNKVSYLLILLHLEHIRQFEFKMEGIIRFNF